MQARAGAKSSQSTTGSSQAEQSGMRSGPSQSTSSTPGGSQSGNGSSTATGNTYTGPSGNASSSDFADQEVQMPGEFSDSGMTAPPPESPQAAEPVHSGAPSYGSSDISAMQESIRGIEQALGTGRGSRLKQLRNLARQAAATAASATSSGGTHHLPFDHHR
jgi:hypothetical protein